MVKLAGEVCAQRYIEPDFQQSEKERRASLAELEADLQAAAKKQS